jgi:hypothetical protein
MARKETLSGGIIKTNLKNFRDELITGDDG